MTFVDNAFPIAMGLGIGLIAFSIFFIAIKMTEGFEMTPELEQEWRVLQICIETDIQLEFCDTRYGGKNYGEPVR